MLLAHLQPLVDAGDESMSLGAGSSSPPIRIFLSGQRLLVWEPRHIYALRCQHRLTGCLVGALPSNKRQAAQLGPPLALSMEEALLAAEEGFAEVVYCAAGPASAAAPPEAAVPPASGFCTTPSACEEWRTAPLPTMELVELSRLVEASGRQTHARIFRDLWSRGWFVTTATKFGADYLVYPGDPMQHHAAHTVHVAQTTQTLQPLQLVAASRLAHDAKKSAVVAHCGCGGADSFVRYICIQPMGTDWNRRGFCSSHGVMAADASADPTDPGPQFSRMVVAEAPGEEVAPTSVPTAREALAAGPGATPNRSGSRARVERGGEI